VTSLGRPSFDLTREPWIPCETLDGKRVELGFEDVLLRAHELAAVHDESPLATAMIHRLLLAILHRVVDGPKSLAEWEAIWKQERFDAERVKAYLAKWRHRFDLFDAERPFMQVARLGEVMEKERGRGKPSEAIPPRRLALERSGYSGASKLLEHGGDDDAIAPAQAVRDMLGFIGFGPGGRILNDSGYPKQGPLRSGAVVLLRGRSLRESLVLNLLVPGPAVPAATPEDAPAWEHDEAVSRGKRVVRGWLDALTWQARRVELVPSEGEAPVRVINAMTGVGAEADDWLEPMHALVVRDPKRPPEPIAFDPDRNLWRDSTALFRAADAARDHRPPAACAQVARVIVERDVLGRDALFAVTLHGLASSQAAISLWGSERMPLPLRLLADPDRLEIVERALQDAESVERALYGAAWVLARFALASGDQRSPDKKDIAALTTRLDTRSTYWATLGRWFDEFLRRAGSAEPVDSVLGSWKNTAREIARKTLRTACQQLGTSARALRASAAAERHLSMALKELSEPTSQTAQGATA